MSHGAGPNPQSQTRLAGKLLEQAPKLLEAPSPGLGLLLRKIAW